MNTTREDIMFKKLVKFTFCLGLLTFVGLIAVQFDGPRKVAKDLGLPL